MASTSGMQTLEKWPKHKCLQLFDSRKTKEELWNCKHTNYKCKISRENALKEIEADLEIYSQEDIKSKIHTLRSQYRKESRNVAQSSKSGVGKDDLYTPKLWCYSQLHFLKVGDAPRDSYSNLEMTEVS